MAPAPQSPAAARAGDPRRVDARILVGVLLVLASVVVGSRVLSGAERTTPVWAVTRELAAGTTLTSDDLATAQVRLSGAADRYLAADGPDPVGSVLVRPVSAGELLPKAALSGSDPAQGGRRSVTVPVDVDHLPPDLEHGSLVDVWVSTDASSLRTAGARGAARVLADVPVQSVDRDGAQLGAGGPSVAVVLSVTESDVPALVAAVHRGSVDLVGVEDP